MDNATSSPALPARPVPGTPAPWFKAKVLDGNERFAFDTVAGRPIVLFFMGSVGNAAVHAALAELLSDEALFDDSRCSLFGVSIDPGDVQHARIETRVPGVRHFLDYDRAISIAYGACKEGGAQYEPFVLILDHQLRVAGNFNLSNVQAALDLVRHLSGECRIGTWAPVLTVPRILEPELCSKLVKVYERSGGTDSGFMRVVDGKTVLIVDHSHKRRSDCQIEDAELRDAICARINHRLRPQVKRAFNFDATRMERYIVACYDSESQGHFRPHRDNTTEGTAHRRFAVTINLNDDYEGGDLRFPEFGNRTYRAPVGGAIVFGCGLLHEATPVSKGQRFAFLPFLYDEEAARLREANSKFLDEGLGGYRAQPGPGHTDAS